jgi:hypothetical protein
VGEAEDDGDDDGGDVLMGGKRQRVVGEVAWQSSEDLEWQHVWVLDGPDAYKPILQTSQSWPLSVAVGVHADQLKNLGTISPLAC